jgi:hypothetical protein
LLVWSGNLSSNDGSAGDNRRFTVQNTKRVSVDGESPNEPISGGCGPQKLLTPPKTHFLNAL